MAIRIMLELGLLLLYCYAAFNAPCMGHKDDESQGLGADVCDGSFRERCPRGKCK